MSRLRTVLHIDLVVAVLHIDQVAAVEVLHFVNFGSSGIPLCGNLW